MFGFLPVLPCVCVCLCVYVYVCVHICVCAYMFVRMCAYVSRHAFMLYRQSCFILKAIRPVDVPYVWLLAASAALASIRHKKGALLLVL
jgi:hypothetical protein